MKYTATKHDGRAVLFAVAELLVTVYWTQCAIEICFEKLR